MQGKWLRALGPLLGLLLFVVALWALHHILAQYRYQDIVAAAADIAGWQIALSVLLTGLSFAVLAGYDLLALRYLNCNLPWSKVSFAAALSYAFSNTIGLSVLISGSVRYRLYSGWGLTPVEIAKVIAFTAASLWLGVLTAAGGTLLVTAPALPVELRAVIDPRALGTLLLAVPLAYLGFCLWRRAPFKLRNWVLDTPTPRVAAAQLFVGALDWIVAAGVLYVLLPRADGLGFGQFLSVFLVAQTLGLLSHVPGQLGVFESLMLTLLPVTLPTAHVFAALLVFRLVYYLLPLVLATVAIGLFEALHHGERLRALSEWLNPWLAAVLPQLFALLTLIAGAVLLFSGATPAAAGRMEWLSDLIPLELVETSHFIGSVAGLMLVLLARGLQRRLDAAWLLTVILLTVGVGASLLKGGDIEEALVLLLLLASLLPCRKQFYRRSSLLAQHFSAGWIASIALVLCATLWLGLFSYRNVGYTHELWWQFSFLEGDAPRFLRATVGVVALLLFVAGSRLLRPAPATGELPAPAMLAVAERIAGDSPHTEAHLVLLGDKRLLFNAQQSGFVMYGVEGRSWIAMGDPVGPPAEQRELAWAFREQVDLYGGWTVFYQVRPQTLDLYLELGLTLLKIGEEAHVPLAGFSLEGSAHKGQRAVLSKLNRAGCEFSVLPAAAVVSQLPRLGEISDAWMGGKTASEKGFSLGFFQTDYLARCPLAVVCQNNETIAFANLWLGGQRQELSIDLMRFVPEAPAGVMDYLFINLMLWGKAQGYGRFNLGMAPLAGLESRSLAPLWNHFGALVFGHGERFYNFQGLRQYKSKFHPDWESRYLAVPNGVALPRILVNLSTLIARGLRGLIHK